MVKESVIITDCDLPGTAITDVLSEAGLGVTHAASNSADDIVAAAGDAEALVVQWATIDDALLDRLPNLKFISRLGIGYDMIDVGAATRRGIAVANTPAYCVEEVAAHTVAMILSQARGLKAYDAQVQEGRWAAVAARPMSIRPSLSTVSIVGYGRIGSLVAASCAALGFQVLIADPYQDSDRISKAGYELVEVAAAIARADILTLHAPLTEQTHHLIDTDALASMKSTSSLVNTCRGPLVDENALADALEHGVISGAALDVFESEPLGAASRLRGRGNVQLSPHAAWYSPQSLADLPVHAALNVVNFLSGKDVEAIVNPNFSSHSFAG
ncbi:C-terminal binding protein [Salinibacterium sp. M195]|uniref:C-terminal binding protein n=1 Tax=Salinibacterium sp. M195 TaxID=2583374 RepID=UPI001C6316DE|nr:C-terminal binding protein [Salinibacterium sp. M195]QYH36359.1 C-terminal binding protein [Salinibacterium sp. M195]